MSDVNGHGDFGNNTAPRPSLHRVCDLDNGLVAELDANLLAAVSLAATSKDHSDYTVEDIGLDKAAEDTALGRVVVGDIGLGTQGFHAV